MMMKARATIIAVTPTIIPTSSSLVMSKLASEVPGMVMGLLQGKKTEEPSDITNTCRKYVNSVSGKCSFKGEIFNF